jgi:hypothetical protein
MEQIIACGACATKLKVKAEYAGRKVRCPKCSAVLSVPAPALDAEIIEGRPPDAAIRTRPSGQEISRVPRSNEAARSTEPEKTAADFDRPAPRLPKLGSLAQAARSKQLKVARIILAFIGVITLAFAIYQIAAAPQIARNAIQAEMQKRGPLIVDVEAVVRNIRLLGIINIVLGVLYLVFAVIVYLFPVAVTIVALVLYVGINVTNAVIDPHTIYQGLILKVVFIVCLAKAIQAAIAYQKERAAEQRWREEEEDYEPSPA